LISNYLLIFVKVIGGNKMNNSKVLESLNKILEHELAGVVKYTHYAFMVQGPYRLSVVQWLREQALESLTHAEAVGEHITSLGEHPTLKISDLLETHKHSTEDILNECLDHEREAIKSYYDLLNNVDGNSIMLEEFARTQIAAEEMHEAELKKMLLDNF
jgi:bacterioferritin